MSGSGSSTGGSSSEVATSSVTKTSGASKTSVGVSKTSSGDSTATASDESSVTSKLSTGKATNYSGYSSSTMDDLLARATETTDVRARAELYGQAVGVLLKDNPIVYTYRLRSLTVHAERVAGVEVYSDGVVRLGRAAFLSGEED